MDFNKVLDSIFQPVVVLDKNKVIYKNESAKKINLPKTFNDDPKYTTLSCDGKTIVIFKENNIGSFLKTYTNAFAHHKIVLDRNKKPTDYIFIDVNDVFLKILNLKREDIIGKRVTQIFKGIKKDNVNWISIYGKVALTQKSISFETYSKINEKWFKITAFSPKKLEFITIFEDITESKNTILDLKKAKEELEAHEKRYKDIIDNLRIPILVVTSNLESKYCNSEFTKLLGYTLDDIKGKNWQSKLISTNQKILDYEKKLSNKKAINKLSRTVSIKCKNSEIKTVKISHIIVQNEIITTFEDQTELLRAQQVLLEEKQNYELIVKNAPVPILVHDGQKVILANEGVYKLFNVNKSTKYQGYDIFKNIPPETKSIIIDRWKHSDFGPLPIITEEFFDSNGKKIFLTVSTSKILFQRKPAFLVMFTDQTKEIETKESLRKHLRSETLLSIITSFFVKSQNKKETMENSLEVINDMFNLTQTCIFEINNEKIAEIYEWKAKNVPSQKEFINSLPAKTGINIFTKLSSNGLFMYKEISDIKNKQMREFISHQKVKSMLIIPLTIHEKFNGYFTLTCHNRIIGWSKEKISLIKSIGEIISAGLLRFRIEEELKQKVEELQKFQDITVNRELKMISLKEEINNLTKSK
ncbi:PAS domain S-box protein [Candidatus Woesearchaeota archaeon]|nr:PAS domain S-box protein [Candidatus Woesearchaeota archaeon]